MTLAGVAAFAAVVATVLAIWLFMRYDSIVYDDGYPTNPFKWAQERRRRDNKARARRISRLEHELGYRPCSDDKCGPCNGVPTGRGVGRGHPIWDNPALPAPPPMDLTAMVKQAYDSQVAWGTKTIPLPPPPTAEPGRIKK